MTNQSAPSAKELAAEGEELVEELKETVSEAKGILNKIKDSKFADDAKALTEKLCENVELLKAKASEGSEQVKVGLDKTEKKITENPWPAVGIALGVGVLIGIILSRGCDRD